MQVNNNTEANITLPEAVQKAVEKAQDRVTIAEIEAARLRNLCDTERANLVVVEERKATLTAENENLADINIKLIKDNATLENSKKEITADIEKLNDEIKNRSIDISFKESELSTKQLNLSEIEEKIGKQLVHLDARQVAIDTRELDVTAREQKIKDFVTNL